MSDFIHLHNHTHYSLLDGAIRIPDMIDKAIEFEMPAIAITDHGNMFGAIDFYMKAKKAGIKPIIGSEMYVAPGHRSERKTYKKESGKATYLHLVLLAKNNIGYKNLMKLSSIGYLEGYYYKPRIDLEVLEQYHEGLIASSACLHGAVSYTLLHSTYEAAHAMAKKYKDIFGDDYYIELQNHGLKEEIAIEESLIKIARDLDIKLVATNDAHYLEQDHYRAHDVLLCLQTGKDYDDPKRMRYATDQLYLKSPQEMKALFKHVPEAIENTLEIAEKCNVEIDLSQTYLPNFEIPGGMSAEEYFHKVAYDGLKERYPVITPELTKRLDYEIGIINQMGFPSYFLIVKDFIDYARDNGIPVGPGRGSAAGSLAAYATRITNVDPMEYDLIFERFLNPERVTMPDIDIDFCYERREEVIDYVREKYGESQVSQIITFGTMAAKAVVRDVGRVLKMPYSEVDRIAKLIPVAPKMNLQKAFEIEPELTKTAESDEVHQNLMSYSRTLEGLSRHQSTHACGVVITPTDLTDYVPLYRSSEGDITTQYEMKFLEEVGVLKMDFLGLRTLTVIADTLKALERRNVHVDVDQIPIDDQAAFDVFAKGQTIGIFQFESSGMQNYLKKLKPTCIQDLIAMNALYRPGPMSMIDDFIARKHGLMKMEYPHPMLEPILKETYGVIVYQEQVMRIASTMGGFTLGGADLLRRAMGKKKVDLMKEQRVLFVKGAQEKGVDETTANDIFDLINKFAGYGFNKSHAACYSVVAYQTAYLRAHYPTEFFAANLTSEMGNIDRVVILIDECRKIGINVLPPDINESYAKFVAIDSKTIRFGLGAVKNVGLKPIKAIVEGREKNGKFKTLFDFLRDIDLRLVNKKVLESLIQVGAMDSLEGHRAQLMECIDLAVSYAQRVNADKAMGQFNIFGSEDAEPGDGDIPPLPMATPWDKLDSLRREKELLGFYISGHPLKQYEQELQLFNTIDLRGLKEAQNNQMVRVGGLITTVRTIYDKKGKTMAFVGIEDFTGSSEILVFSSVYSEYREQLQPDSMIMVLGKVSIREGEDPKILMEESLLLEYARERFTRNVLIDLDSKQLDNQFIESLTAFFKRNKGDCPIYFRVNLPGNERKLIKSKRYLMDPGAISLKKIQTILGDGELIVESRALPRPTPNGKNGFRNGKFKRAN